MHIQVRFTLIRLMWFTALYFPAWVVMHSAGVKSVWAWVAVAVIASFVAGRLTPENAP